MTTPSTCSATSGRRARPAGLAVEARLACGRSASAPTQIGASLYELAPGQRRFPTTGTVEEEWLIVLSGEPTLRDPSGERRLATGDAVVFKRGPEGAHSIRNDTEEPSRLLMLSSDRDSAGEIAFYPDSGKIGSSGGSFGKIPRRERRARLLPRRGWKKELDRLVGDRPRRSARAQPAGVRPLRGSDPERVRPWTTPGPRRPAETSRRCGRSGWR